MIRNSAIDNYNGSQDGPGFSTANEIERMDDMEGTNSTSAVFRWSHVLSRS